MKNKLINGNFNVWQRGDVSGPAFGYGLLADRFFFQTSEALPGSMMTVSKQYFTVGQTDVPNNPKYFQRVEVASGNGPSHYSMIGQKIEGATLFAGESAVLTFWAKAESPKNVAVEFVQHFDASSVPLGGGSGVPATIFGIGVTVCALTTSWQKFTVPVNMPSAAGAFLGPNNYLGINFWLEGGSDYNARTLSLGNQSGIFDFAQMKFEPGTTPTPFEDDHPAQELVMCQRYFQKYSYGIDGSYLYIRGYNTIGNNVYNGFILPTKMRVNPFVQKVGMWAASNCGQPSFVADKQTLRATVVATSSGPVLCYQDSEGDSLSLNAEF